jgi:hypothetical protein
LATKERVQPQLSPQTDLTCTETVSTQAGTAVETPTHTQSSTKAGTAVVTPNPTPPSTQAGKTAVTTNQNPGTNQDADKDEGNTNSRIGEDSKTSLSTRLKTKKGEAPQQTIKVTIASIKAKSLLVTTMQKCLHEISEGTGTKDEDFGEMLEKDEVFHDSLSQVEGSIRDVFDISPLSEISNATAAPLPTAKDCDMGPTFNEGKLSDLTCDYTAEVTVSDLCGDLVLFRRKSLFREVPGALEASTSGLQNITSTLSLNSPSLSLFSQAPGQGGELKTSTPMPLLGDTNPVRVGGNEIKDLYLEVTPSIQENVQPGRSKDDERR